MIKQIVVVNRYTLIFRNSRGGSNLRMTRSLSPTRVPDKSKPANLQILVKFRYALISGVPGAVGI
jgi:hypothetical protein